MPEVSVIIPTYQRRADVVRAVASAVAQTHVPAEIVVIDDGSNDGTGDALAAAYPGRVRYLWKPNGGVSAARNLGMAVARGDYLALLDSDDEWLPTKLERQVALLEAHPGLGMALTDLEWMDPERRPLEVWRRRTTQLPHDGDVLADVMRFPSLIPSTVMLRREVVREVGGFDERLVTAEDLDFHLRVAMHTGIGLVAEPLTRAMRSPEGLSQLARTYHEYLHVVERFVAEHRDEVGHDVCDRALVEAYLKNARGFLWTGELGAALRCGLMSVRHTRHLEDAPRLKEVAVTLARGLAVHARRRVIGR